MSKLIERYILVQTATILVKSIVQEQWYYFLYSSQFERKMNEWQLFRKEMWENQNLIVTAG